MSKEVYLATDTMNISECDGSLLVSLDLVRNQAWSISFLIESDHTQNLQAELKTIKTLHDLKLLLEKYSCSVSKIRLSMKVVIMGSRPTYMFFNVVEVHGEGIRGFISDQMAVGIGNLVHVLKVFGTYSKYNLDKHTSGKITAGLHKRSLTLAQVMFDD